MHAMVMTVHMTAKSVTGSTGPAAAPAQAVKQTATGAAKQAAAAQATAAALALGAAGRVDDTSYKTFPVRPMLTLQ